VDRRKETTYLCDILIPNNLIYKKYIEKMENYQPLAEEHVATR
jgi:hypothetical protein